jgi:microcystin-dependent protein
MSLKVKLFSEREVPIGTIQPYGGDVIPDGFFLCDGTTISRTDYATLFAAIGTTWGYGNNSTTFHLPDLRGNFLRGVDKDEVGTASGRDTERNSRTALNAGGATGNNVGTYQGDKYFSHVHGTGNHRHQYYARDRVGSPMRSTLGEYGPVDWVGYKADSDFRKYGYVTWYQNQGFNTQGTSSETKDINASVKYIIRVY